MLPSSSPSARALMRNFTRFSLLFAINHGCVTAVLNLSVVILGEEGSFMSGALYVTYAATALVASSAIIAALGTRGALICGSFVYCVYVFSLPLALLAKTAATQATVAVVGGAIGGIAAGFLWAAQGAYFAASAKLYVEASRGSLPLEEVSSKFAAKFGVIFLGCELVLKALPLALKAVELAADTGGNATLADTPPPSMPPSMPPLPPSAPPPPHGPAAPPERAPASLNATDLIVAVTYSILAICSAVGMFTINDLDALEQRRHVSGGTECAPSSSDAPASAPTAADAPASTQVADADAAEPPSPEEPKVTTSEPSRAARGKLSFARVAAAVLLWRRRPQVLLLAPVQITFGLCAALIGYELSGRIVPKAFPQDSIIAAGLLSALIALVSAVLQVPFKKASALFGKSFVMLTGLLAFATLAALCLVLEDTQLAHAAPLVLCYMLQGVGRACYEGTNKALYADFFRAEAEAAFANIVLAVGTASAIAYFTFPEMSRPARAATALVSACLATITYIGAEVVQRRQRQREARDDE